MAKTITQLPAAPSVSGSAVVATDNAAGTETQKVTLAEIAALASYGNQIVAQYGLAGLTQQQQNQIKEGTIVTVNTGERYVYSGAGDKTLVASYVLLSDISPSWNDLTDVPADFPPSAHTHVLADITDFPVATANGQVVTWDNTAQAWVAGAGGGGSLPVATNNGDVIQWDSTASAYTATNALTLASITFPDASVQSTAGLPIPSSATQGDVLTYDTGAWVAQAPSGGVPNGTNNSDILYWNSGTSAWATTAGNPGTMPTGSATGDTLKWDSSLGYYISSASPVPLSASTNDILSWNGSAWVAVMPSTPGLPSGSAGQALVYDGTNWVAGSPFPSASSGQYLYFDGSTWSGNNPLPTSGNSGDVLTWDSAMSIWIAAAPTAGIPAPASPNDGDLLRYNGASTAWEAAAPSGLTANKIRSTSDQAASNGSMTPSSFLNVAVAGSATYMIQGLALLESDGVSTAASLSVTLSAGLSDGDIWLDSDFVDTANAEWSVILDSAQSQFTAITDAAAFPGVVPIRFRGWLETSSSISSTNLIVNFGDTSGTSSVTLKAGSWLAAIKMP